VSTPVFLDTGALIGLERRKARVHRLVAAAHDREAPVVTVLPVITEWWRGSPEQARLRRTFEVLPLSELEARVAGNALGASPAGPGAVDAILMAAAARHGAVVLTGDVGDLESLAAYFPSVRVLAV